MLAVVAVAACAAAAVVYQRLQAAKVHAHAGAHTGVMSAGALGLGPVGKQPQPQQVPV